MRRKNRQRLHYLDEFNEMYKHIYDAPNMADDDLFRKYNHHSLIISHFSKSNPKLYFNLRNKEETAKIVLNNL